VLDALIVSRTMNGNKKNKTKGISSKEKGKRVRTEKAGVPQREKKTT